MLKLISFKHDFWVLDGAWAARIRRGVSLHGAFLSGLQWLKRSLTSCILTNVVLWPIPLEPLML